eukprot:COSAG06_NODE_55202_length_290_cov_2.162304_1_plen_60_part_01
MVTIVESTENAEDQTEPASVRTGIPVPCVTATRATVSSAHTTATLAHCTCHSATVYLKQD